MLGFGLALPESPPLIEIIPRCQVSGGTGSHSERTLDADQQALLTLLGSGTHGADTLSARLNSDINRCLACLTALEIAGRVQWVSGGYTAIASVTVSTLVPSGTNWVLAARLASGVRCGPVFDTALLWH